MVELRLESIYDGSLPADCYVSVRLGEMQKLSRLSGTRTYRFPTNAEQRLGKIEVFKRVGACSIDVDPANSLDREVQIGCGADIGMLGLKVHMEADQATKQQMQQEVETKKGNKMKAAKEYLSKHGVEVLLSEAMSAVLRARPDQPVDFIVEHLQKKCGIPPSKVEKPSPKGSEIPSGMMTQNTEHFHDPAPKQPAPADPEQKNIAESGPAEPAPQVPAAPAVAPTATGTRAVYLTPSVGTWIMQRPWQAVSASVAAPTPVAKQPAAAPAAAPAGPFQLMPSVGTWLAAPPRPAKATTAPSRPFHQMPSVGTWLAAAAPRPAQAAPAVKAQAAPQPPVQQAAPAPKPLFQLQPSVGTWLAPRPRNAAAAPAKAALPMVKPVEQNALLAATAWQKKPSIGTWLAPSPKVGLVKASRCFEELELPRAMTLDQRVEVERVVTSALLEMCGDFTGEYFPLRSSTSFFPRPGGMSEAEELALVQNGFLFAAADADGRGVFATSSGDAAVWLNADDHHVTFVAKQSSADAGAKVKALESAVYESIRLLGYTLV